MNDEEELDLHVAPNLREIPGRAPIHGNTRPVLCRKCYIKMVDEKFGWKCLKCGLEHRWKTELKLMG